MKMLQRGFQLPHLDPAVTPEPTGVEMRCYCDPQCPVLAVSPLNVVCCAKVSLVVGEDNGAGNSPAKETLAMGEYRARGSFPG